MILFSEWKKIFKEGISKIVYHGTNVDKLYKILKNNVFLLSPVTSRSDELHNSMFFMSVSRIKYGGFMRSGVNVNIVLDGEKLSNNLKGKSVNYWGDFGKNIVDIDSKNRYDENEERILSRKYKIDNFMMYIKEIHILLKYNSDSELFKENLTLGKKLKEISIICNNNNISYFYYLKKHEDEFKVLRQKNTELTDYFKKSTSYDTDTAINFVLNLYEHIDEIKNWEDFYRFTENSRFCKMFLYYLKEDFITTFYNEINDFNNMKDEYNLKKLEKLYNIMRKNKIKSIKDFSIYLYDYVQKNINGK